MKKMIFGSALLLSGVIGFTNMCIAATQKVERGARSSISGCLHSDDWIFVFIFAVMALAGLIIATIEFTKK